jgi:hypothetical protein
LLGNLLESGHFKDQEEDGKIILSWISWLDVDGMLNLQVLLPDN